MSDGTLWDDLSAVNPSPWNLPSGGPPRTWRGAFVTGMGWLHTLAASGTLTTVKRQGAVDQAQTSTVEGIPEDARLSMTVRRLIRLSPSTLSLNTPLPAWTTSGSI